MWPFKKKIRSTQTSNLLLELKEKYNELNSEKINKNISEKELLKQKQIEKKEFVEKNWREFYENAVNDLKIKLNENSNLLSDDTLYFHNLNASKDIFNKLCKKEYDRDDCVMTLLSGKVHKGFLDNGIPVIIKGDNNNLYLNMIKFRKILNGINSENDTKPIKASPYRD